ncbi:MAG: DUF2007 domain-containing protein [Myxococcaceae bacterium]|nr:DUF2007 domain-containing protein [Myxococcaceae bacterium]MCI0673102.1 DUF2007 domain-containing protein [Myxococcaceae bacterium]
MSLVLLSAHPLPGEARLVANLLLEAGLQVQVRRESLAPLGGELPLSETWTELWLPAEELPRARELLARVEAEGLASATSQPCPRCREDNPGNFELCWACGVDLPPLGRPRLAVV